MKPLDHPKLVKDKRPVPLSTLPPELIKFIESLARMAAREDYEYFCRTGQVFGYDGTTQE